MGSSKKVTVGYRFHMGMHMLLSYPVDSILKVRVHKRTVWEGEQSGGTIEVDKPGIFGGDDREGGFVGDADLLTGAADQQKNEYLMEQLGESIPAFRRFFSIVWKRPLLQSNNHYIFNQEYQVKRTMTLTDGSPQWYSSLFPHANKSDIDGNANPAHIIRECLTASPWGLGYPVINIDDDAFMDAADTLHSEGFGLSLLWNNRTEIQEFIKVVLDHINGVLYVDPSTGKFVLKLVREDYDPETLPVLDVSNIKTLEFERQGWGETVNQVVVKYTDDATGEDRLTPPVQDLGNVQIQGTVIADEVTYSGIVTSSLALRVAQRDLKVRASPLARVTITANRTAFQLRVGYAFKLVWPKHDITGMLFRIGEIDYGTLQDSTITIKAVEDVFSMPDSSYVEVQTSNWVNPSTAPAVCPYEQVVEAGYWETLFAASDPDINSYDPSFGLLFGSGSRPSKDTHMIELHGRVGTSEFERLARGFPCPAAKLDGALVQEYVSTFDVKEGANLEDVEISGVHSYAYIDSEMVAITSVTVDPDDSTLASITVDRGICDTVPDTHADEAVIIFPIGNEATSFAEYLAGETVDTKLLPSTTQGPLDLGDAATYPVLLKARHASPYPPGNVEINSVSFPASTAGDMTITWAHRDRTQQTAYLNTQDEGNIGPESGVNPDINTTYFVNIYERVWDVDHWDLILKHQWFDIVSTQYVYGQTTRHVDFGVGSKNIRVEIISRRQETYGDDLLQGNGEFDTIDDLDNWTAAETGGSPNYFVLESFSSEWGGYVSVSRNLYPGSAFMYVYEDLGVALIAGKTYALDFDIIAITSSCSVACGGQSTIITTTGHHRLVVYGTGSSLLVDFSPFSPPRTSPDVSGVSFANVRLKELHYEVSDYFSNQSQYRDLVINDV